MDTLTQEQRTRCMSMVRSRNTKPEMIVRRLLHGMGYRYALHAKRLPGKPDIVLTRHHKVAFVHGCYWHGHEGCRRSARPSSNLSFWKEKLDRNKARDADRQRDLVVLGWKVLTVWECETRDINELRHRLKQFLQK